MTAEIRNRLLGAEAFYEPFGGQDGVMAAGGCMTPHLNVDDAVDEIDKTDDVRVVGHQLRCSGRGTSSSPSL